MKTYIFVYGTLRQQFGNHHFLNQAQFLGDAKTQSKYVMHASSHIPFVSKSQAISQITGEVYAVDTQTLSQLDRLEGCRIASENPLQCQSSSWYTRDEVEVVMAEGGEVLTVWMYFNEHETQHSIIPTGDFADHQSFIQNGERVWYFAYGSNMNVARMLERGAPFTQRKRGTVWAHRLVFNKISGTYPGHGVANIVPEGGFEVRGVLYEVDRKGIAALDGYEGVASGHYVRQKMQISMEGGEVVEAYVYLAHPDRVEEGLTPRDDYFYHLEQGVDMLGDDGADYLQQALRFCALSDDDRFLSEEDLPRAKEDEADFDRSTMALPVLMNGYKARIFLRDDLWSTRVIFWCNTEDIEHFRNMGLNMDDEGYFGTKKFSFLRKGVLEISAVRVMLEISKVFLSAPFKPSPLHPGDEKNTSAEVFLKPLDDSVCAPFFVSSSR
jgi:gamma-glutamylcyclotransferase (GGCT)/AIG2-like uncharacterized protein YtfP